MKTAKFLIIHGDKKIDGFMKAADLFHGKNLGKIHEITITYSERINLTLSYAKTTIPHIKKACEELGSIVSFIHLEQIQNGDTIKLNSTIKPYYDKTAREISDGKKSFVLKQFIEKYTAFTCETDVNFYITNIF